MNFLVFVFVTLSSASDPPRGNRTLGIVSVIAWVLMNLFAFNMASNLITITPQKVRAFYFSVSFQT